MWASKVYKSIDFTQKIRGFSTLNVLQIKHEYKVKSFLNTLQTFPHKIVSHTIS